MATNRVFVFRRKFILSSLKKLPCSFVLKWNFCIAKSSRRITCNYVHREGPVRKALLRNVKCITCGCGWLICLRDVNNSNNKVSDHVVITHVY